MQILFCKDIMACLKETKSALHRPSNKPCPSMWMRLGNELRKTKTSRKASGEATKQLKLTTEALRHGFLRSDPVPFGGRRAELETSAVCKRDVSNAASTRRRLVVVAMLGGWQK